MKKFSLVKLLPLFIIILFLNPSLAQNSNSPFLHFKEFQKSDSSKLFLRFENFNFVKNNEYSGDFTNGTTWIGYVASPKLVYYPSSTFRFEAGVRLQKYSGRENFSETEPVFSAIYRPSDEIHFILGTLNQDNNHFLSEVLYEPEQFFTQNSENGIQILYQSRRLRMDTWVNWEQFILAQDPFQERFTFGVSGDMRINNLTSSYKISIPFQVLFTHRGGEIDNSEDPVQTIGNFSSGLQFSKTIENSRITSWNFRTLAFLFSDNSSKKEFIFNKGHALYPQFELTTKHSQIKIGYWNAYHFAASRGSQLFQSISYSKSGYFEDRRELATFNYCYDKKITTGIHFGGKLDLYYDLKNSKESFATMVYLRINGDFFLKNLRWNN